MHPNLNKYVMEMDLLTQIKTKVVISTGLRKTQSTRGSEVPGPSELQGVLRDNNFKP